MKLLKAFWETFGEGIKDSITFIVLFGILLAFVFGLQYFVFACIVFGVLLIILFITFVLIIINIIKWIPEKVKEFKRNYKSIK